ncbi:MAG: hypothetical protein HY700_04010 [Gemmatimonadetes bacterium]|nr:hypothetical protein [Gemmatimonadota bacterium]
MHTVGYGITVPARVVVEPIGEIGYASVSEASGGLFTAAGFFGRSSLWSLTVALRVRSAGPTHRMGRYGVSEPMARHH